MVSKPDENKPRESKIPDRLALGLSTFWSKVYMLLSNDKRHLIYRRTTLDKTVPAIYWRLASLLLGCSVVSISADSCRGSSSHTAYPIRTPRNSSPARRASHLLRFPIFHEHSPSKSFAVFWVNLHPDHRSRPLNGAGTSVQRGDMSASISDGASRCKSWPMDTSDEPLTPPPVKSYPP